MVIELNESTAPAADANGSGSRQERVVSLGPADRDVVVRLLDAIEKDAQQAESDLMVIPQNFQREARAVWESFGLTYESGEFWLQTPDDRIHHLVLRG